MREAVCNGVAIVLAAMDEDAVRTRILDGLTFDLPACRARNVSFESSSVDIRITLGYGYRAVPQTSPDVSMPLPLGKQTPFEH